MPSTPRQTPSMEAHYFGPSETDIVVTKANPYRSTEDEDKINIQERIIVSISDGFSETDAKQKMEQGGFLEWDDYLQLSQEQQKYVSNASDIYVQPPGTWEESLREAIHLFNLPFDKELGENIWDAHKDVLWSLPEYHSHLIAVTDSPEKPDSFSVNTSPLQFNQIYLSGRWAIIFAECEGGVLCIGLNRVQFGTINLEDTKILPNEEATSLSFRERYKSDVWVPNLPDVTSLRPEIFAFNTILKGTHQIDICTLLELEHKYDVGDISYLKYRGTQFILGIKSLFI